jgi:predicted aspartyl protease
MGMTYVEGTVVGPSGERRAVEFLVDSGATYSVLPEDVWKALSLAPKRRMGFRLADGTRLERDVSDCRIELAGQEGPTPVVLGEPGDVALLGVITLENLGFVFDPFRRELQAMQMRLG